MIVVDDAATAALNRINVGWLKFTMVKLFGRLWIVRDEFGARLVTRVFRGKVYLIEYEPKSN